MTSSLHPRRLLASRQQGSIIIFAALGLSLAVILLAITDMGFLYFYKREYQKAADLAAMAGARHLVAQDGTRSCEANALPAATNSAAQNLGSKNYGLTVSCGRWLPTAEDPLDLSADPAEIDAVRAVIAGSPPRFMPFMGSVTISARAIALADQPLAQLSIRSTLATVDTTQSALLNTVIGGLLGGSINLPVAAWNGLLNTNINLLQYLDALAVELGVGVGNYDQVLGADVTLGQLLGVAADVLNQGGGTGSVGAAVLGLDQLSVLNLPAFDPLLNLGDLLDIQTGTPSSGLDTNLNVLNLVQGSVQLANKECAACASVAIPLPGVAGVSVRLKAIEPSQLSSIGNPALARTNPTGPDQIYVRTAQVRAYLSVDLPALSSIAGLLNSVLDLLSPVTTLLNDLLQLNLVSALTGLLGSLVGIPYEVTDIQLVPGVARIDVSLDVGAGEAYVTDYSCPLAAKTLSARARTSAANLRIGKMDPNTIFASSAKPTVEPLPLVDIGVKTCRKFLGVVSTCQPRRAFAGGGIGLKADTDVLSRSVDHVFVDPPELANEPLYYDFETQDIVDSLSSTLSGVNIQLYQPTNPGNTGGLGGLVTGVGGLLNGVIAILQPVVSNLLSPILDPLVNMLLNLLGVDLAQLSVGANLSCDGGGATLVD